MDSAKWYLAICLKPLAASAVSAELSCFSPVERLRVSEGEKARKAETQGEGKRCEMMSLFPHRSFVWSRSISRTCCSLPSMLLQRGHQKFRVKRIFAFVSPIFPSVFSSCMILMQRGSTLCPFWVILCVLSFLFPVFVGTGTWPAWVLEKDLTWWLRKGFAPSHLSHLVSARASSGQGRSWAGSQPLPAPLPVARNSPAAVWGAKRGL